MKARGTPRGASRRPAPPDFAREILRLDVDKYLRHPRTADWVFFDRGVIDALGMLQEVAPMHQDTLAAMLSSYAYHVFRDVPWNAPFYEKRGFRVVNSAPLSAAHLALEASERQRGLRSELRVTMAYDTAGTAVPGT